MQSWAESFYKSRGWKNTREAYMKHARGLCERCLSKGIITPAEIVHHKVFLTPENINDPYVSLNWQNLEAVCRDCHAAIHEGNQKRYKVDEYGRVTARDCG